MRHDAALLEFEFPLLVHAYCLTVFVECGHSLFLSLSVKILAKGLSKIYDFKPIFNFSVSQYKVMVREKKSIIKLKEVT